MSKQKKPNTNIQIDTSKLLQKQLGAFIIDWLIIAIIINLITTFSRTIITGEQTIDNYFPGYPGNQGYILGITAFVVSYIYMVIFPLLFKETLGKKWLHIKIVKNDGSPASFITRTIRFFVITIVEPRLYNFSLVFYLLVSMITGVSLGTPFEIISWVVTIISGMYAIIAKNGMFHDKIANTKVVLEYLA